MPGLPRKSTKKQFLNLMKKSGKSKTNTAAGAYKPSSNISTVERKVFSYQQFVENKK